MSGAFYVFWGWSHLFCLVSLFFSDSFNSQFISLVFDGFRCAVPPGLLFFRFLCFFMLMLLVTLDIRGLFMIFLEEVLCKVPRGLLDR